MQDGEKIGASWKAIPRLTAGETYDVQNVGGTLIYLFETADAVAPSEGDFVKAYRLPDLWSAPVTPTAAGRIWAKAAGSGRGLLSWNEN